MARSDYQLKFVIDQVGDVADVLSFLNELGPGVDRSKVLLMPQGVTRDAIRERGRWLVEECKKHGLAYCPRLHIELYDNVRGT